MTVVAAAVQVGECPGTEKQGILGSPNIRVNSAYEED